MATDGVTGEDGRDGWLTQSPTVSAFAFHLLCYMIPYARGRARLRGIVSPASIEHIETAFPSLGFPDFIFGKDRLRTQGFRDLVISIRQDGHVEACAAEPAGLEPFRTATAAIPVVQPFLTDEQWQQQSRLPRQRSHIDPCIQSLRVSPWIMTAIPACGWLSLVLLIWLRYPGNHGEGRFWFPLFFVGVLLVCLRASRVWGVRLTWALVLATLGLAACWFLDRHNMMIDDIEWVDRGKPEWGGRSSQFRSH